MPRFRNQSLSSICGFRQLSRVQENVLKKKGVYYEGRLLVYAGEIFRIFLVIYRIF